MTREKRPNHRDSAEVWQYLGVQALTFLAGQPEPLGRFLALSGIGPADLRAAAGQPEFLTGVIDFLLTEEPLLVAFAQSIDLPPEKVADMARRLAAAGLEPMD